MENKKSDGKYYDGKKKRKTWLDLNQEELKKLSNVTACMYGRQIEDSIAPIDRK